MKANLAGGSHNGRPVRSPRDGALAQAEHIALRILQPRPAGSAQLGDAGELHCESFTVSGGFCPVQGTTVTVDTDSYESALCG